MKKIAIVYGSYDNPIERKAIELLSKILLDYTAEYPICVSANEPRDLSEFTRIYIGTKNDNCYINKNSNATLSCSEEYSLTVTNGEVMIEGYDEKGVLYGSADFYNKYISVGEYPHDRGIYWKNIFEDSLPDFQLISRPDIKERGIWTWGHVIYDYRGFVDNMVMLKMNTLIIWNDEPPINAKEMVEYAHNAGIKVIWGYSWLWDTSFNTIDVDSIYEKTDGILAKYENDYADLGGDGIYFQSFTEMENEYIGGKLIAETVTDFVNKTSNELLKKHPDLELQFGLHATSVKKKLQYIKNVDKRVRIVWEDCGAFPFAYLPSNTENFDEMKNLTEKISVLRGDDDRFGAVTKGITNLDWHEFEHIKGRVYIGEGTKTFKANRTERKRKIWRYLQAYWLENADKALETVKLMADKKNGDLVLTVLVEDGLFEESIMHPVALFSEMMWNTKSAAKALIREVALRSYVEFA